MKKYKAIMALVLVAALFVTLFAACANTETPNTNDTNTNNTNTDNSKNDTENKDSDTENKDANTDAEKEPEVPVDEEPTEVLFYYYDMVGTANDYGGAAKEAVQAYVLEKLNIDLKMEYISPGDWTTKIPVSIAAGERMDLISLFNDTRIGVAYPGGLLMDITDILAEYGKGVSEVVKDTISGYTFGGRVYGIPTLRNYAKSGYILANGELCDELGLTEQFRSMKSWSDYEALLKTFKETYGDEHGIYATRGKTGDMLGTNWLCEGDSFDSYIVFDNLGDSRYCVFTDNDGNVSLIHKQKGWINEAKLNAEWMEKGYMWPDSPITTEFVDNTMKQGLIFSYVSGSEYGVESVKSTNMGFKIYAHKLVDSSIKSSQTGFSGLGIPYTAEEPEAAMRFIDLIYTDATLMDLLVRGVEGKDYELVDGQAKYPEGNHYAGTDYVIGNNYLLTPLYGQGADFYERVKETNDAAPIL